VGAAVLRLVGRRGRRGRSGLQRQRLASARLRGRRGRLVLLTVAGVPRAR
jgi:hypothetical protein